MGWISHLENYILVLTSKIKAVNVNICTYKYIIYMWEYSYFQDALIMINIIFFCTLMNVKKKTRLDSD